MMTRHDFLVVTSLLALLVCSACVAEPGGDVLGEVPPMGGEALNGNALDSSSLVQGTLVPTMLNGAALTPDALSAAALAAIQGSETSGTRARELLYYAVTCALGKTQSFSFTWVDTGGVTHYEKYDGLLGLAPGWAQGPLDAGGERWVSACLISRVNYFGLRVMLSSRGGTSALDAVPGEFSYYTNQEGAFWGNLFAATPTAFACDHVPNDDHSRALNRVCAAGYDDGSGVLQDCGIIARVGSCASACGSLYQDLYYSSCSAGAGQSSTEVVTVFLE